MKINFILPTYENYKLTIKCLESIEKHNNINYEAQIIWVDNNSSSLSKNKILNFLKNSNLNFKNIFLGENLGFIKAVNIGIKYVLDNFSSDNYVGIINNDIEVSKNWLEGLVKTFDCDEKIGCVGSLCYDSNKNNLIDFDYGLLSKYKNIKNAKFSIFVRNFNMIKFPISNEIFTIDNFIKNNFCYTYVAYYSVLFKLSIFKEIGFLDEKYHLGYGDDTEFNYRICKNGYKLAKSFKSLVSHIGKSTFKLLYNDNEIFNIQESNRLQLRISKRLNNENKKKYVIYTCISGNYDKLIDLSVFNTNDFDYVCFTNSEKLLVENHSPWIVINVKNFNVEVPIDDSDYFVKFARFFKTHPHLFFENYEKSIWIDGNINAIGESFDYLKLLDEDNYILSPIHPNRNNIYEEIIACNTLKKDKIENLNKINKFLINENFPKNTNLVQTGVLVRDHKNKECIFLMEKWWEMIKNYSRRDQLSFNYIFWKYGGRYLGIPWDLISKTYFSTDFKHRGN